MKEKIPIETLLSLREQGLTYREIGDRTGLDYSGVRKRILSYQKSIEATRIRGSRKEKCSQQKPINVQVFTYKMPPDEIERRYGRPGQFAEKQPLCTAQGW